MTDLMSLSSVNHTLEACELGVKLTEKALQYLAPKKNFWSALRHCTTHEQALNDVKSFISGLSGDAVIQLNTVNDEQGISPEDKQRCDYANKMLNGIGLANVLSVSEFVELDRTNTNFQKALNYCLRDLNAKQDVVSYIATIQNPVQIETKQQPQQQPKAPVADVNEVPMTHRADFNDHHIDESQANAPQERNDNFDSHHVYGKSFALCFSTDKTRQELDTIAVDGAKAIGSRKYDWKTKLRLQITRGDLPTVACVFFNLLNSCELTGYGADQTKRFSIKNQGKSLFVNMSAKGFNQIAVPISAEDAFELRSMFLQQLLAKRPSIGVSGVMINLKLHAEMLQNK